MFCNNCGTQIEDGAAFCPNCGAGTTPTPVAETPVYQAPVNEMPYQQPVASAAAPKASNGMATAALLCGIFSLVICLLGSIMFGVWGAAIALVLGIVAVVLGINAKKATNGDSKASAGFICGLIGLILSVVFAIGCAICGSCSGSYGCYGCVGASCKAQSDLDDLGDYYNDLLDDLEYYY